MKRREFLKKATLAAAASSVLGPVYAQTQKRYRWRMTMSWPKALDVLYGGAEHIAKVVEVATEGRLKIEIYEAGKLGHPLKVFETVQEGKAEMGHTATYYYLAKHPALAFGTAVPFGLNFRQQNAWFDEMGTRQLNEVLADFGLLFYPAGNTGVQAGGWFRFPVNSIEDVRGLRMRIPGLGGTVMERLGAKSVVLPAAQIYDALKKGEIDAAEWVGPHDDEKLRFYEVARYYHYPGWWEPGATLGVFINARAWKQLDPGTQKVVRAVLQAVNAEMMANYDRKNPVALERLIRKGAVLHAFPKDMLQVARKESEALLDELSDDPAYRRILADWRRFRTEVQRWFAVEERTYLLAQE